ncbi:LOB domain-containing protein 1-like [Andrographis paniculata]|uniref:LOB domain-containing protein 1-like n=1 Tax=Andrographis paniculata TaxID=175694 RepID=UPI0021E79852|nr:LOB domain-containing protein 1-like [Andrographis paniculata]
MAYPETPAAIAAANNAAAAAAGSQFCCLSPTPSSSPPPQLPAPPPAAVIFSPCAACRILRRRCVEKCALAPYFPPAEPLKFSNAHRVFGASNIIKLLQELPENQREDAVNSMVYEANARLRDPVYGCAGVISQLQKQINKLQAELAKAQAEVIKMQFQNSELYELIYNQRVAQYKHEEVVQEAPMLSYYDNDGNVSSNFFLYEDFLRADFPLTYLS